MSVDVFGRHLTKQNRKSALSGRGPPGNGFKFTADGQYDINYKRLCNIADPIKDNDAVPLKVLNATVQEQLKILYDNIFALKNKLDEQSSAIQKLKSQVQQTFVRVNDTILKVGKQGLTVEDIKQDTSKRIDKLESELH